MPAAASAFIGLMAAAWPLASWAAGVPAAAAAAVDRDVVNGRLLLPGVPTAYSKPLPKLKTTTPFPFSKTTVNSLLVLDAASGDILLSRNSQSAWPIASITKLMTAMVVLDRRVPLDKLVRLTDDDDVGGAKLRVAAGSSLTVRDLLYSALVGSANDCANAAARSTGLSRAEFVTEMNKKAGVIGLDHTRFVDPSGIEVENESTARDTAKMMAYALNNYGEIRRMTSTAKVEVQTAAGDKHKLTNTNDLLTDAKNGIAVFGGKTGYLNESQWNLVVKARDWRGKPVIAVLFGSDTKSRLFQEAKRAVNWVWGNYAWPKT